MDWTKVKTKHYLNSGLTMQQRGVLVTFICLVAHLERMPTIKELNFTFTSRWRKIDETFTRIYQNTYETIAKKVLEDVEKLTNTRQHNRDRQKTYRKSNANKPTLCNAPCNATEKRREEKREKEKSKPAANSVSFLESLKNNPAYKGIDLERELSKMDAWLLLPKNKKRQKTPSFILNWLNKIESPVSTPKAYTPPPKDKTVEQMEKWKKEAAPMPKECKEQLKKFGIRSAI